jgi:hypothetical protein
MRANSADIIWKTVRRDLFSLRHLTKVAEAFAALSRATSFARLERLPFNGKKKLFNGHTCIHVRARHYRPVREGYEA